MGRYDSRIKKEARNREFHFFRNHMRFLGKKAEDLRVVCLPGEEAWEIKEVYAPLKVPIQNIVGIERDDNKSKKLIKNHKGIDQFTGTDVEFFEKTNEKFDIISLDYEGQLNEGVERSLRLIAGRQLLNPKGLMLTNFFGSREHDKTSSRYLISCLGYNEKLEFIRWIRGDYKKALEDAEFQRNIINRYLKGKGLELEKFRSDGFTKNVVSHMIEGKDNLYMPEIFRMHPKYEEICKEFSDQNWFDNYESLFDDDGMGSEERERRIDGFLTSLETGYIYFLDMNTGRKHTLQDLSPENHLKLKKGFSIGELSLLYEYIQSLMKQGMMLINGGPEFLTAHLENLKDSLVKSNVDGTNFQQTFVAASNRPYFLSDIERYRYTNIGGSRMYMDLYFFDQMEELLNDWEDLFTIDSLDSRLKFWSNVNLKQEPDPKKIVDDKYEITPKEMRLLQRKQIIECKRIVGRIADAAIRSELENLKPREILKRTKRKTITGMVYYEKRIQTLRDGKSTDDLWDDLLADYDTTRGQLRAYEAHVTMRRYGPSPEEVLEQERIELELKKAEILEDQTKRQETTEKPAILDVDEYFVDVYQNIIGTKHCDEFMNDGSDSLVINFADYVAQSSLPVDQKNTFLDNLKCCCRDRPLSRVLYGKKRNADYSQIEGLLESLKSYIDSGKAPSTEDIIKACKNNKIL